MLLHPEEEAAAVEEKVTSQFVPALEAAVQEYVTKWQDRSEAGNFSQKHDPELIKDELRPIVFEEIRGAVSWPGCCWGGVGGGDCAGVHFGIIVLWCYSSCSAAVQSTTHFWACMLDIQP
jgi:hypothetical protein